MNEEITIKDIEQNRQPNPLTNILFLDVETVVQEPELKNLSQHGQDTFTKRFRNSYDKIFWDMVVFAGEDLIHPEESAVWQRIYEQNACILAEYAKVACVSIGIVDSKNRLHLKSFCGPNETELLTQFGEICDLKSVHKICAHNGKIFDFPFLVRRHLINSLKVPYNLRIMGLKPWEMKWVLDTMEMWNLGDLRYNCGLDRLAYALGIESPKGDMDGSKVGPTYYSSDPERFEKIATYCENDVIALAAVYARLTGSEIPTKHTSKK